MVERERMEGKREEVLRKGPWKAEEDEVLRNHVSKFGPRDWSSIRSKGLLQRTGKSCRLRWVNKLRPNLKNGCKFSVEEERVVIELQAEFGNKWARIATYLPGRTDNDVKNFWSSRQKRLARFLHSSSTPHNKQKEVSTYHQLPFLEGHGFSSSEGESSLKVVSCSLSSDENSEMIQMVSLGDLIKPKLISFKQDLISQPEATSGGAEKNMCIDSQPTVPFPSTTLEPQLDVEFTSESHELLAKLEPYYDVFGPKLESGAELLPFGMPFVDDRKPGFEASATPDCFFDDFPVDMFDQIESLPSP